MSGQVLDWVLKEEKKMDYLTTIIPIFAGMLAAAVYTAVFYYANKPSGTSAIDWKMFGAYEVVGIAFGAYAAYSGMEINLLTVTQEITAFMAIVLIIDQALAGYFKSPMATFVLKYTGHSFFPIFKMTLSDGTVQTFNTATTGRCCCIGVAMQPTEWSPGFKVLPAFADGVSPYSVALAITTGRNSDLTTPPKMEVKWGDLVGDDKWEEVPLTIGKNGNPEGTAVHTFKFFGN